jgi:hypothetical protein
VRSAVFFFLWARILLGFYGLASIRKRAARFIFNRDRRGESVGVDTRFTGGSGTSLRRAHRLPHSIALHLLVRDSSLFGIDADLEHVRDGRRDRRRGRPSTSSVFFFRRQRLR